MKRVLFLMESLSWGGAEKVLVEILQNIDYDRFSVDLLLVVKQGVYLGDLPDQVHTYAIFRKRLYFRIIKKLSKLFRTNWLYQFIINRSISNIYDLEVSFLEGVTHRFHSLHQSNARKITWVHCNLQVQRWWLSTFKSLSDALKAYLMMDKIIFVSNDAQVRFLLVFEDMPVNMGVFYNPINKMKIIESAKEFQVSKDKLTLCAIGRLEPQKRFDRLIRVAKRLSVEGFDFDIWILGGGHLEHELEQLVADSGIASQVRFLGFKRNPYPYLLASDIFVNTSITEGFPLVIAEAVCLGKAIVATSVTGTTEILDNGSCGLLTGHSDDEIYAGLKKLMVDPEYRKKLEIKATERSSMFDIKKSINLFEQILEEE